MFPDLNLQNPAIQHFCETHRIRTLSLFGSRAKGTAGSHSDVDLLVDFEPENVPGLIGMAALEEELSLLLDGRKVDLRTASDLSHYFREEVVRTSQLQYAR